jgi:tRNA 2-thiocytidine biosynthesis protein TtcA
MLMAKCLQELQKYGKISFELKFLVMNPGYNEENVDMIKNNSKILKVPVTFFESGIFDILEKSPGNSPCYLCARMRRGHLYNKAKELGCNKIALGHHFDDVIETIMLSMTYGGEIKSMMPKLFSDNFEGMELIRPMYLVREASIISWKKYNGLNFLDCGCRFTQEASAKESETVSKRAETKELIKQLKKVNPYIEKNIFKSVENVHLNAVIAYKKDGVKHNFLDKY